MFRGTSSKNVAEKASKKSERLSFARRRRRMHPSETLDRQLARDARNGAAAGGGGAGAGAAAAGGLLAKV